MTYEFIGTLLLIAVVGFIQNMAFTFSGRSRNSGDPTYHRKAAILSNSVWFICNYYLIFPQMMKVVETGDHLQKFLVMLVYVLATTEGSVVMMRRMLKKETGKRKVGSDGRS